MSNKRGWLCCHGCCSVVAACYLGLSAVTTVTQRGTRGRQRRKQDTASVTSKRRIRISCSYPSPGMWRLLSTYYLFVINGTRAIIFVWTWNGRGLRREPSPNGRQRVQQPRYRLVASISVLANITNRQQYVTHVSLAVCYTHFWLINLYGVDIYKVPASSEYTPRQNSVMLPDSSAKVVNNVSQHT